MGKKNALIIFAREPVPGKVKTRLNPELTRNQAAHVYKQILNRTIKLAIKSDFTSIQLWVDGKISHPFFCAIKKRYGIKFYSQYGHDLGSRMFYAFKFALRTHSYAVLIGSDCPGLTFPDLEMASRLLLQGKDVVLGPANDGGYYLIGLKKNNRYIFENMKWGSSFVFNETNARAESLKWKSGKLPMHIDVDNARDFRACCNLIRKSN